MPDQTDDDARRAARGRTERATYPGIPTRHLPPVPRVTRPDDVTPPEPINMLVRARQQTQQGLGGTAPRPAPPPPVATPLPADRAAHSPPRSLTPPAESQRPAELKIPGVGEIKVKRAHLRTLWVWVAPFVLSALGFVGGAVKGYFVGLAVAHDEIVKIRESQQLDHDRITRLETKVDADEAAATQEARSNRAERATAMRKLESFAADVEAAKRGLPHIEGIQPAK